MTNELIEEFTGWLDAADVGDVPAHASHAEMFLDWWASNPLDAIDDDALTTFLLEWCPRHLSLPANESAEVCEAVAEFTSFLGRTGRLTGGPDRARKLMRTAQGLTEAMREKMADPSNYGMAKSLFAGIADGEPMTMAELQAAVQRRMDEHNALPLEQRRAETDRFFTPPEPAEPPVVELPFLHIPPPESEVVAVVAAAALPAKVEALRNYLGEAGKPLTATGNLKLADGRALVELLDTGDVVDPVIGDKTFTTRSTADLGGLTYLMEIARGSGAVRTLHKRLVPVKSWSRMSLLDRATRLFRTVLESGILSSPGTGMSFYSDLHTLVDSGVVHWLAGLIEPGTEVDFYVIAELNGEVIDSQFVGPQVDYYLSEGGLNRDISRILQVLEMAGVVDWADREESFTRWETGFWVGGTVRMTAFGRHVLPDYLPAAGIRLRSVADLTDVELPELLAAMESIEFEQFSVMLAAWKPSLPPAERAGIIASMAAAATDAQTRLVGLQLLGMFDTDVAEPHMRQLLDTDAAGHAAIWLMEHDLAEADAVGGFVTPAIMVDILSQMVDHPDVLCEQFLAGHDPEAMLEFFWRHRAPETAAVLDVLGQHLPDRKLAKQARKAAMRHRSWLANQGFT